MGTWSKVATHEHFITSVATAHLEPPAFIPALQTSYQWCGSYDSSALWHCPWYCFSHHRPLSYRNYKHFLTWLINGTKSWLLMSEREKSCVVGIRIWLQSGEDSKRAMAWNKRRSGFMYETTCANRNTHYSLNHISSLDFNCKIITDYIKFSTHTMQTIPDLHEGTALQTFQSLNFNVCWNPTHYPPNI